MHPLCFCSLLCLPFQSTLCWPRSPLTPSAPGEEARTASSALFGRATTRRLTSGMTSTAFMGTPSGVAPVQQQHLGREGRAVCGATAPKSSPPASTSMAGSTSPWTRTESPLWACILPPPCLLTAWRGSGKTQ